MGKNVVTIPATISRHTSAPITSRAKRRVAAYARVSTEQEEQLNSYEAQVDFYTNYIKSRDDWEFVRIFTDSGVTGCNTKRRTGFQSMVEEALAGRIDLIITKSVSRFARNTVDSLTTIRKLKEHGVECYFEKENIWTFDGKGELLLTIMSSLAQEESRSISENCIWGQRKRMADGKYSVAFSHFLGYDKGENGEFVINEEQAKIVRRIFGLFLKGRSPVAIAKLLMEENIPSPTGKEKWYSTTVKGILTNEKYRGSALLQKTYTADFLTKQVKKNRGEVQQYYVEDGHPAIIDPAVFDMVQRMMEVRHPGKNRASCVGTFSSMIRCGDCGSWYGSKVWHSTDKYRRVIWRCNHKYDNGTKCSTPHFTEDELKTLFLSGLNSLIRKKTEILKKYEGMMDELFPVAELAAERNSYLKEMNLAADRINECIARNARVALNQVEYQEEYERLAGEFETIQAQVEEVQREITDRKAEREKTERFIRELGGMDLVEEFNESIWYSLVDHMTVYTKKDVRIVFKDGTEIRA